MSADRSDAGDSAGCGLLTVGTTPGATTSSPSGGGHRKFVDRRSPARPYPEQRFRRADPGVGRIVHALLGRGRSKRGWFELSLERVLLALGLLVAAGACTVGTTVVLFVLRLLRLFGGTFLDDTVSTAACRAVLAGTPRRNTGSTLQHLKRTSD